MTEAQPQLRITSISIRETLGIREGMLSPGRINLFRGPNASGKSSIATAIQATLGRGSLAKLQRLGAEDDPEVVLVIDGPGARRFVVEKRGGETVRVRQRVGTSAAFEDVKRPQEWVSSLFDPISCNPFRFLQASDKDRALLYLEALPLSLDEQRLSEILGEFGPDIPPPPRGLHALEHLAMVRDSLFRARTGVNRDQDGKAKAADQTLRSTVADIPDDPAAEHQRTEKRAVELERLVAVKAEAMSATHRVARREAERKRDDGLRRLEDDYARDQAEEERKRDAERAQAVAVGNAEIEARNAEFERAVAELRAARDADVERIRERVSAANRQRGDATATALKSIEAAAQAERSRLTREAEIEIASADAALAVEQEAIEPLNKELAETRERLAALGEQTKLASAARAMHEQARRFQQEAEELEEKSRRMTATIAAIDAYRASLAESSPIPGLEMKEGVLHYRGVPWDQVNTAQRIRISVQVAVLRAAGMPLPVIFVDGAEALDAANLAIFLDEVARHPVQAFVFRVDDPEKGPDGEERIPDPLHPDVVVP